MKNYILIYDEPLEEGFDLFTYENQEELKDQTYTEALYWSDRNETSDYQEYLYQKYGNDFYKDTTFEKEKDEFYKYVKDLLKVNNGYDYLINSGFGLYRINKKDYDKLFDRM